MCGFDGLLGRTFSVILFVSSAAAQVPEGSYVVAATSNLTTGGGSGVWVVDPRVPGNPARITGLSQELTNFAGSFTYFGSITIEVRQSDGTLVVGDYASTSFAGLDQIDLHVITLQGFAVVTETKINIGQRASGMFGSIGAIESMATGDFLVGASGLLSLPPMNGSVLGIVNAEAGTVRPVPLTSVPSGALNAAKVDPLGATVYFAMVSLTTGASELYRVPILGGQPELLLSFATIVGGLAFGKNGALYVTVGNSIKEVDPATLQVSNVISLQAGVTGVTVERASGNLPFCVNAAGVWPNSVILSTPNGGLTQLATIPSGGSPTDIAVKHNPWTYGADTPATNAYRWQTEPNPGGLPRIGNDQFGLELIATPSGNASGALLVSLGTASIPVAGIELLLDPATMLQVGVVPPNGYVPLPLPDDVGLIGAKLFFQSVHLDSGVLASSNGLRMTVMQ